LKWPYDVGIAILLGCRFNMPELNFTAGFIAMQSFKDESLVTK
jgi:hypothetical protein